MHVEVIYIDKRKFTELMEKMPDFRISILQYIRASCRLHVRLPMPHVLYGAGCLLLVLHAHCMLHVTSRCPDVFWRIEACGAYKHAVRKVIGCADAFGICEIAMHRCKLNLNVHISLWMKLKAHIYLAAQLRVSGMVCSDLLIEFGRVRFTLFP